MARDDGREGCCGVTAGRDGTSIVLQVTTDLSNAGYGSLNDVYRPASSRKVIVNRNRSRTSLCQGIAVKIESVIENK